MKLVFFKSPKVVIFLIMNLIYVFLLIFTESQQILIKLSFVSICFREMGKYRTILRIYKILVIDTHFDTRH